ncbi:MAG TPA: YihY/virulence factor BrkB family protein [Woeseiaceae bacterium]|jgi:membrane protein|nr:YihY/virulence factor BrkB family protein [Woeseiaceae bacterium]
MIGRIGKQLDYLVWGNGLTRYGVLGSFGAGVLRNLWAVLRDIASGQLNLRAMSLVYTTLLSIVPLIAVSFSALKAFGVHEEIEPHLYGFLEPLGPKGIEITDYIMNLVNNVNSNVLGGIGFIFFIYTAISMVQKVENSFNYVWYVSKSRSFATRLVEYSTVLIVGAVALGLSVKTLVEFSKESLVVEMQENVVLAPVFGLTDRLMPYLVTIGIFTLMYKYMPNTRVRLRSAIVGGVAAGFLWATTATVFASFIANSSNRQAIYASLAVAISALIWVYLNWIILLIGSQIAFYYQNPAYLRIGRRDPRLSNEMRERVALNIMYMVGREHRNPGNGVDLHSISRALRIPSITLAPIALGLEAKGLLATNEQEQLLPGKEMSRIRLTDILDVVRVDGETGSHRSPQWDDAVKELGASIDGAVQSILAEKTLSQLLDEAESVQ